MNRINLLGCFLGFACGLSAQTVHLGMEVILVRGTGDAQDAARQPIP